MVGGEDREEFEETIASSRGDSAVVSEEGKMVVKGNAKEFGRVTCLNDFPIICQWLVV